MDRPFRKLMFGVILIPVSYFGVSAQTTREKLAEALKPMHESNMKAMAIYTCNMALINFEKQNALDMMNLKKPPMSRYDAMIAKGTECIGGPGKNSVVYFYRATAYAEKGDTKLALADLENALVLAKAEPNPVIGPDEILEERADLYTRLGDRARAEVNLREALRLNPTDSSSKDKLDNLDNKIAEARKKAAIENPQTAADFIIVGNENFNRGKDDLALAAFERSLSLSPSVAAYVGKGRALWSQNRFDAALAEMNKALALSPKDRDALRGRGYVYRDMKRWDDAIADYNSAMLVSNAKEKATLLNDRGRAYAARAAFAAALKDHDAAMAASADDTYVKIEALTGKGNALFGQGKPNEAIAAYTAGITAAGNDYFSRMNATDAMLARGRVYSSLGKKDLAKADFTEVLKIFPDSKDAKAELAKLSAPASDPGGGTVPAGPAASGKTAEQWFAEGRRQGAAKDYDGAVKSFTECLRLKPDAAACYAMRGGLNGLKGNMPASRQDFEKALQSDPKMHADVYFIRGMMYAELAQKAEAIADFRAVLKLAPNNEQAKRALTFLGVQP